MHLSVQCFTLRNEFESDVAQALNDIAKIGFKFIETAGTYGLSPPDFANKIRNAGLQVSGMHVGLGELEGRFSELMEEAEALDSPYVILPWISELDYAPGWGKFAHRLEPIADDIEAAGRKFSYHNHAFEFARQPDGRTGYDTLFGAASERIKAETDVWWALVGGEDPADLIRRHGTRTPLVHLKDGTARESDIHAPVGKGILEWDSIIKACNETGVEFGVVELDNSPGSAMDAVAESFEFLTKKYLLS